MAKKKKKTKRKLAHPKLPMQRHLNLRHEGTYFDLRAIFDNLNERYFRGRLRRYKVIWGRRRKHRPREHFIFGTIQEEDRVIRINPALDQPFVPLWFLRYVLYHEMLHSVVPEEALPKNRRRVHTEEFNRLERQFPDYRRARRSDDEGVVATFFLIRYQSVVASRSEINFACQFFRIGLFILAVQQNFGDPLTETLRSEIALDSAPMTNGNSAGLLRNHHRHCVGFFSDPQTGPVTQSKAAIQCFPLAYRKNTRGGCDSSIANDHATVMERSLRMEDGQHQFDRELSVDDYACFLVNTNRCIALDRDQRAKLFVCQLRHCLGQVVNGFPSFTGQRKNRMPSKGSQTTAQLRLKNNH